jgi:hypothetical protein
MVRYCQNGFAALFVDAYEIDDIRLVDRHRSCPGDLTLENPYDKRLAESYTQEW